MLHTLSEKALPRFLSLCLLIFSFASVTVYAQETDEYLLWTKRSNYPDDAGALANQSDLDADGNLYVIGSFYKSFPWPPDPTQTISMVQIFVRKYDTDGNLLWSKEFGTDEYYSYGGDIRVDKQGDIVFTGFLYDLGGTVLGQPVSGFFLAKMDSHGNLNWITPFTKTSLWTWGERFGIFCKQSKMEIDQDNSIVLYSNGNPPGTVPQPSHGLYISRYSSSGSLTHQYQITHDDNFDSPGIGGLAIDKNGNFIVTGYYHVSLQIGTELFGTPGSQSDRPVKLFLAKFSSTGVFIWAKVADRFSSGGDVDTDELGNIYLTGSAEGHATLGGTAQINSGDPYASFIAKLDSDGSIIWSNPIWGARPTGLKRTSTGELYVSGTCYNGLSYANYILRRPGLEASFVLKINSDASFGGTIVSDDVLPGGSFKMALNSSIDDAGNIYTVGNFSTEIVFGCDTLLTTTHDMFITKYSNLPPAYNLAINGPVTLCSGEVLSLSATIIPEPVKYFWTIPPGVTVTSQTSNQITASVGTEANGRELSVMIRKGCYNYQSFDTYKINMQYMPAPITVSGQQVYCEPGTVRFNANGGMNASSYVWQLPIGINPKQNSLVTTDPYIDVIISNEFEEGVIAARAKNECSDGELSAGLLIQVIKPPTPISFLNIKDAFCNRGQGEIFEVTNSKHATEYVWTVPSNMNEAGTITSVNSSIQLTSKKEGLELLSVYARNMCHRTEEIIYPIKLINPLVEPKILKSKCDLELTTDGAENIEWFKDAQKFDQDAQTITLLDEGEYYVTVANFCGTVASTVIVADPLVDEDLFIPNFITPNSDGKNDVFTLTPLMDELSLEIFNRWGKTVYHNTNYKNDWDGSSLEAGMYYFQAQHFCLNQKYKGWVQIIR